MGLIRGEKELQREVRFYTLIPWATPSWHVEGGAVFLSCHLCISGLAEVSTRNNSEWLFIQWRRVGRGGLSFPRSLWYNSVTSASGRGWQEGSCIDLVVTPFLQQRIVFQRYLLWSLYPPLSTWKGASWAQEGIRTEEREVGGSSGGPDMNSLNSLAQDQVATALQSSSRSLQCPYTHRNKAPGIHKGVRGKRGPGKTLWELLPSLPCEIPSPSSLALLQHISFHSLIHLKKTNPTRGFPSSLETWITAIWHYNIIPLQ